MRTQPVPAPNEASSRPDPILSELLLRRASNLSVSIRSTGDVVIDWKGRDLQCGPHGLAILDVFSQPVSFRKAMTRLSRQAKGPQDRQDLLRTVVALRVAGVLFDAGQTEPGLLQAPKGFDKPWIHIKMLNDRQRTAGYIAA